jgi:NADH-quinone oxidoreductase subunit L
VVLAAGAVVLGFLGLPHFLHAGNFMGSWLGQTFGNWSIKAPAADVSAGLEIGLMVFSLAVGVAGIAAAWAFYRTGPSETSRRAVAAIAPLHKVVANKFYVDEAYDLAIVRPFRFLSTVIFNFVDRFLIDLVLVEGAAFFTGVVGRVARWFQNGDVQRYFAVMVAGAAAIFLFSTCEDPDFTWTAEGQGGRQFTFKANVGAGPVAPKADGVTWDFDGDGKPDPGKVGPSVTHAFDADGEHKVVMTVVDGVFGEKRTVTKTVKVGKGGKR